MHHSFLLAGKCSTDTMLTLGCLMLMSSAFVSVSATYGVCNCDDDGFWGVESILHCQKVSDFLIALAYFSIPLELLYFISCSNVFPFKWVIVQFGAFIVLCGLTHLLNVWTYVPHSFDLMLSLTIFKFLTALVSCATAITLVTLIPQLLRVKIREVFLKQKARELDREVGMMKRQEEASWHVRMLTQEIRKSLDRHTILHTTLVELSKTLLLQNCAVWMPNTQKTGMILMYEFENRNLKLSIPFSDPGIIEIKTTNGAKILDATSALAMSSSCSLVAQGGVAAIRMPLLKVSNFKGGTPETVEACYAILVLVLPGESLRAWRDQELEIVEVVAGQVAVALSHAAVLEESQLMHDELESRNRALQLAKSNAMMASEARNTFQKMMSDGMRKPMYTISALLSVIQCENLTSSQRLIVDTMLKTGHVISKLINDDMGIPNVDHGSLSLEVRPIQLHSMIKEVVAMAKCLCSVRGFNLEFEVERSLPEQVIGDEKRILQVILHMVGNILNCSCGRSSILFRAYADNDSELNQVPRLSPWKTELLSGGYVDLRFEFKNKSSISGDSTSGPKGSRQKSSGAGSSRELGFTMCKRIVQMMQGNIWLVSDGEGLAERMTLMLRLQVQLPTVMALETKASENPGRLLLKGLNVLVADGDGANRAATRIMLEKLGCQVTATASGLECLAALSCRSDLLLWNPFRVVILDLFMPGMDGFEIARRIRKTNAIWPLIIALTSSTGDGMHERCLQVGMNGVIRKPVMLDPMADELSMILQRVTAIL